MKYSILTLIALAIMLSCSQKNTYIINGAINDMNETTVYLQKRMDGEYVTVDSAKLVEGKFSMNGNVDVVEEYYISKGERDRKMFFLENVPIKVVSDSVRIDNATVNGGPVQELYNEYSLKYDRLYEYMLSVYYKSVKEENADVKKLLENEVDSLYENIELFQKTFMLEHLSSPLAAHILTRIQYGKNAQELNSLLVQLDTSLVKMNSYKSIVDRVAALEKVSVGKKAPNFTQTDLVGNPIMLADIYRENKYTLLDFWASWCGPCRAENPNVVKAYNKYNKKGFTVLGVSLDSDKDKWSNAIEHDSLFWNHVSDLKGWNNSFSKEYAVNSIPANFLIDSLGFIVAVELRGEKLQSKLEELLGE